jgi:hypothetical protein
MKRLAFSTVLAVAMAQASFAPAQDPAPPGGEPTGQGAASAQYVLSTPLRLSLQSTLFPVASAFQGCASLTEASGNSVHGFPVQRYSFVPLAPRLVLHGFSSVGCPVDGAMGGGITYSVPVRPTWSIVMAAGLYGSPFLQLLPRQQMTDLRVDVVQRAENGRSYGFGVGFMQSASFLTGAQEARGVVTFGGGW